MNRIAVIYHNHESMNDNVDKTISTIKNAFNTIYVLTEKETPKFNTNADGTIVLNITWPSDADNQTKRKNWVRQYIRTQQFNGYLHIIEDNVEVLDAMPFVDEIEYTMDVLDYDSWFSTSSDKCNYVYNKFNPRLTLHIDSPKFAELNLPECISFTSHSNTCWEIFNYAKISDDLLKFDERFTIAMFFIIEYFARRRNTKNKDLLYYMNQYLHIQSELKAYKCIDVDDNQNIEEQMKTEDAIFKEMNVEYQPDNNIDELLENFYAKLKSKIKNA